MEHIHSLCFVEENESKGYPELYDKINLYASKNYAVIYAVEADSNQTVRRMSQHGVEVETLVESGALTIVNRNAMYSMDETDTEGHALLDAWHLLMLKVKRRSNFGGILAIGTAESFFEQSVEHVRLVKYEEIIGKKFHIPLEAVCCYSANAIANLSLGELVAILNAHHSTIHNNCHYREWEPHMFIELAHKGIDHALGSDLSRLIFKTMKLCYKVDDTQIVSDPSLLERMLLKVMGKNAADVTLAHIKEEVKKSIAFVF
jgi:hypothetical protein